nr:isoform 2 of calcium/calmodulin-dependent protein kinase kinase 1 [Quercus suber]
MGVTLYCLRYGHIPFEKHGMLELYESIRSDPLPIEEEKVEDFADLMRGLLEKDPDKRITMDRLRVCRSPSQQMRKPLTLYQEHPWVTKNGTDPLLSAEENCADIVGPATDVELENAITGNMSNLLAVMKAVKRFKHLLLRRRPSLMEGIFGRESKLVAPPGSIRSTSQKNDNRIPLNRALVTEGVHQDPVLNDELRKPAGQPNKLAHVTDDDSSPSTDPDRAGLETQAHRQQREETSHHQPFPKAASESLHDHQHHPDTPSRASTFPSIDHAKGHAHDPMADRHFLDVGVGASDAKSDDGAAAEDPSQHIVSESPPGVDDDIYERAYQEELQRILSTRGGEVPLYLTRRVEHRSDLRDHQNVVVDDSSPDTEAASRHLAAAMTAGSGKKSPSSSSSRPSSGGVAGAGGLAGLVKQAQRKDEDDAEEK